MWVTRVGDTPSPKNFVYFVLFFVTQRHYNLTHVSIYVFFVDENIERKA